MLVRWRHENKLRHGHSRHQLHALLIQPDAGHARARRTEGGRGAGIAGILDPDVVARPNQRSRYQGQRGLCAWQDHDLVRIGANAPAGREIMRQRLAQADAVDRTKLAPGSAHGTAAQAARPHLVRKLPEITMPRPQRY